MFAFLLVSLSCLSLEKAAKLHTVSDANFSLVDMDGAARVAQMAYEQQLISSNMRKALSNASCFLEAAHSAGLKWSLSDAENHLLLTAHGIQKKRAEKSAALVQLNRPFVGGNLLAHAQSKYEGLSNMVDDDDKDDFLGEAVEATLGLFGNWILTGQPPSPSAIASTTTDLAATAIGIFNPVLGAVAGMVFSVIGGLISGPQDDPMVKMYNAIMKEVGVQITKAQSEAQVLASKAELEAVMDELQWMPSLLGGTGTATDPSDEEARTLLTYNVMIQHDLAKMTYKIQNSNFGASTSEQTVTNEWAAAVFPLAEELILLQTNLLFDIAAHDMVQNAPAAAERVLDLLLDWKTWIEDKLEKAKLGNKNALVTSLNWRHEKAEPFVTPEGSCHEVSDINPCTRMNCPPMGTAIACEGSYGAMGTSHHDCSNAEQRACSANQARSFFDQHVAPNVGKILTHVEDMIASLQGFQRKGLGICGSGFYAGNYPGEATSLQACIDICKDEKACRYFVFLKGVTCTRYNDQAADCTLQSHSRKYVTYKRVGPTFDFTLLGNGGCDNGFYDGWKEQHAKNLETCFSKCRTEPECKYIAFLPNKTCSRFGSNAGDCSPRTVALDHFTYKHLA